MAALDGVEVGTVAACWRHPVKSFQGFQADAIEVELSSELGLAAVRDVEATLRGAPPGKSPERVELTVHARGVDASVVWRGE